MTPDQRRLLLGYVQVIGGGALCEAISASVARGDAGEAALALIDEACVATAKGAQDAAAEMDRLRGELAEARANLAAVTTALGDWMDGSVPMRHTPEGVVLAVLAHVDRLTEARDEARAERDARIELTADNAEFLAVLVREYMDRRAPESSSCPLEKTLRAHAGKVAR